MTLTTCALVRLLLRVMVTVPLPATIVPVTLVVLHPAPVHTEIGSAFAVPWARARTPKTARARNDVLRFENLGISRLLRGGQIPSLPVRSPGRQIKLIRG